MLRDRAELERVKGVMWMQSEDGAGQRSRGFDYLMDQGCAGFARQWVPGRDGDTRLCKLKPLSS